MSLKTSIREFSAPLRRFLFGPRPIDDTEHGPSEELQTVARDLRETLDKYRSQPDPLAAMMTDIFNKRAMELARRGQNGK